MTSGHRRSTTTLRRFALAAVVTLVAWTSGRMSSNGAARPVGRVRPAHVPISFEVNQGQSDARVKFLARGNAYTLFLTSSEMVLSLTSAAPPEPGSEQQTHAVVRLRLSGANPDPAFEGLAPLPARSHYFIGRNRHHWRTAVPHYARVGVRDVYPGIDQVFYGAGGELEYDFVVAPGADPSRIRLAFDASTRCG